MPDALVCPTCSAPLEYPQGGAVSLQCPYCKTTVLLNQQTRSTVGSVGGGIPEEFRPLVERALHMAAASGHVGSLNKIQAIKFYRQATGVGLAEAKRAVESVGPMSVGRGGPQLANQAVKLAGSGAKAGARLALFIVALVLGFMLFIFAMVHTTVHQVTITHPVWVPAPPAMPSISQLMGQVSPPQTPQFADQVMAFGTEGIGPGQFTDARAVAIDGQGHIYVGEYSNGRVQVFDSAGKYLSEFFVGKDKIIVGLAADRAGTVYVIVPGHILRYTGATGTQLQEMQGSTGEDDDSPKFYTSACIAPGGDIYAVSGSSEIVRLAGSSGKIVSSFKAADKVGEDVNLSELVVLSTGEIFALDHQKGVFKFGADGRYINRFGNGKGDGKNHLGGPQSLAADGQGHLFISDGRIAVYDYDGNYIDDFGGNEVVFGLAVDDQDAIYGCYRNRNQVRKFVVAKH
jgi:LSD1 subclass zinc finger protein